MIGQVGAIRVGASVMDMSANAFSTPVMQAAPRYVHDLRPGADAAATCRATASVAAFAPVGPPSPTQTAEVSRSMAAALHQTDETGGILAGRVEAGRVEQVERTLKPYGVAMLPRGDPTGDTQHSKQRLTGDPSGSGLQIAPES